jgi:hypothetical protein
MNENRRDNQRYSVSLYVESKEPAQTPAFIRNLSATGFLVSGPIFAGEGGVFHATFRVHPRTGNRRIRINGRVVRRRAEGGESEYGISIEGFGCPEDERAYMEYVEDLRAGDRVAK